MAHILAGIHTQDQHVHTWLNDIDAYRPAQCPHCGRSGLWVHGVYYRQAQCERPKGNPVPIPRFRCQYCRRTWLHQAFRPTGFFSIRMIVRFHQTRS